MERFDTGIIVWISLTTNSSTKVSDSMTQFEQLDTILEGQRGILKTSDVAKQGIPKSVFYNFVREKELEQVAHGVYVSPDAWGMYLLHLRCSKEIFPMKRRCFPMIWPALWYGADHLRPDSLPEQYGDADIARGAQNVHPQEREKSAEADAVRRDVPGWENFTAIFGD